MRPRFVEGGLKSRLGDCSLKGLEFGSDAGSTYSYSLESF